MMLLSDRALAQTMERAEGMANAAFVDARAHADPASGACWTEVAGARVLFDAPGSPCTQTFGLGLFEPVKPHHLDRIEAFFEARGAETHHEISPLADRDLWPLLTDRGYTPFEFTSVMAMDLAASPRIPAPGDVDVTRAAPEELPLLARLATEGWEQSGGPFDFEKFMKTAASSKTVVSFIARIEGQPVATGALNLCGDVALLAGASTLPAQRRRGAQRALLAARLTWAAGLGCRYAMMGAEPGSASQKNAQRQGFQILYSRMKWRNAAKSSI